jgi:hypothetical protein
LTRRGFVAQLAGSATTPALSAPSLDRFCRAPLRVEFPSQPPRLLDPGPARPSSGVTVADFPQARPLTLRQVVRAVSADLAERTIEVRAEADATFNIELAYPISDAESFYSWHRRETAPIRYVQDVDENGKTPEDRQLFPFAGALQATGDPGVLA